MSKIRVYIQAERESVTTERIGSEEIAWTPKRRANQAPVRLSHGSCDGCIGIETAGPDSTTDHRCDFCRRPLDLQSLMSVARGDVWQGPVKPQPNQHAITLNLMAHDASRNYWQGDEK